ncbi:MAG: 1-phosphofructokinase family hexose kinase [Pyramidobacter sp.]
MIVTVTLDPAVDEQYLVDALVPGKWTCARKTLRMPGGRGINVALMLTQLGYSAVAMGFLAGFNGEYIRDALRRANVSTHFVNIQGESRTNVYISTNNKGLEGTSVYEEGPMVDKRALQRFMANYRRMLNRASAVVLGGALPPGVPREIYRDLSALARQVGLPVYIDAYGSAFLMALETQPRLAKIPDTRIQEIAGEPLLSIDAYVKAAKKVFDMGIHWSVLAYTDYCTIFATPDGIYSATIPHEESAASFFNTRDARMAGIIVADAENMPTETAIRFAMACAALNSTHLDKNIIGREAVNTYFRQVKIEKLE